MNMFKRSAQELKSIRCLAVTGVLSALYIVMNAYLVIPFADTQITFGYIALAIIAMLYGPVVSVFAAIPCDILAATLRPDVQMNLAWTPNRMLEALILGIFLYGYASRGTSGEPSPKKFRQAAWATWQVLRIAIARLLVMIICYTIVNSLLIYVIYNPPSAANTAFWTWMVARSGLKNVVQYPLDLGIMFAILPAVRMIYDKTNAQYGNREAKT
ncbi:MAG: folate family ECF transporter S component [Oscillospiraceae bacterium]|nr:folate family ECF transporter S component [Oscillospiraceae bacterium]